MKIFIIFLAVLLPFVAFAESESFDARVQRAKLAEASPDGAAYQKILWKQIGEHTANAMQYCFPKGAKADTDAFTLVGDVGHESKLHNIEVRPATPMSSCFANSFAAAPFPQPSEAFDANGVPLEIDMKIKP